MLPKLLNDLMSRLIAKGSKRTPFEQGILEELEAVDNDLDNGTVTESTTAGQKTARSNPSLSGPNPGTRCTFCGR